MISIAFKPTGIAVTFGDHTFENNPAALAFAMDAISAGPVNRTDYITFRKTPIVDDSDIDAANELYADMEGEDIETEPFGE